MARLIFNAVGENFYESGVDRGVFYPNVGSGLPWNGLVSIDEADSESQELVGYMDGVRYVNRKTPSSFSATISAFTYPDELDDYQGTTDGYFPHQRRHEFGLSYRTRIGTEGDPNHGYKIHIVYNATAEPSDHTHKTVNNTPDTTLLGWTLTTRPTIIDGHGPSSHLVVDTRIAYPWAVEALEDILYGDVMGGARLPQPEEVWGIFEDASILKITDNGDGTWTAEGPDDAVRLYEDGYFEISWPSVVYLNDTTYKISSL